VVVIGLILASFLALPAAAQQSPPATIVIAVPAEGVTQQLELKDGTRAIGRVESVTGDRFTFRTISGVAMEVDRAMVQAIGPVTGEVVNGEFWPADPNPTRLFFAPTGRSLKKGESYFGVYEILLPFVQYGITDRISIGGGTPLVFGGDDVPFWVTPKVQIYKATSTEVSLGVLHFFNVGDYNLGIAYGVVTTGSVDSAFTVGAGYAYERSDDDGDDGGSPLLMVGGERRVSRRIKLVTENYVFHDGGLVSGGVRFLGERLSVDLGLVTPIGVGEFIAVPIINFVWKF
jgi:hypothetical protein